MDPKLKHDFVNNCLRLEILQKMLLDDLSAVGSVKEELLTDYAGFLEEQLGYAEKLKSFAIATEG